MRRCDDGRSSPGVELAGREHNSRHINLATASGLVFEVAGCSVGLVCESVLVREVRAAPALPVRIPLDSLGDDGGTQGYSKHEGV